VVAVLIVALGLRVGQVQRSAYAPVNDAGTYLGLASQIAHTGDYPTSSKPGIGSSGTRGPSALFPPGFPYFLAGVGLLTGHTTAPGPMVEPARLSQAVLGTVTVGLIGLVALEAFGGAVGMAALVLAAISPVLIETSSVLLAENLLIAFELAAVYCGLRIRRAARPYRWVLLAGVFTGLAVLTHQNGLVLVPPLAVTAWSTFAARTSRIRALIAPAVMALTVAVTVSPWTVRNALDLHRFIPISDQAGETLFGTYNPTSAGYHHLPYRWFWPARIATARMLTAEAAGLREPDFESRLLTKGLDYIREHPASVLAASFHNTLRMLDLEGSFAWESSVSAISIPRGTAEVGVVGFWLFAILAALGALTSYARRAPRWMWFVPILFALSTIWIRMETPRFRLPIDPFLILLAACAVRAFAEQLSSIAGARFFGRPKAALGDPSLRDDHSAAPVA
jgi:4-amino-4-deoxy-L-arabinose transferase-like glycosyltransferase